MSTARGSGPELLARYGPTALVTGAAQGIGAGFARALAARGFDLVLTDINGDALNHTAAEIGAAHGITVRPVQADLGREDGLASVVAAAAAEDIGLLVCNHLRGSPTAWFLDGESADHLAALDVNVGGYVALAHAVGRSLRDRGRGGIVLMSSMTGVVGSPAAALYGASKAFVLAFGSALAYELERNGVDVLTLVPSSVNTETYRSALHESARGFAPMEVDDFVAQALSALGRRSVCVPGRQNALTAQILGRLLPRRVAVRIMGRSLERIVGL